MMILVFFIVLGFLVFLEYLVSYFRDVNWKRTHLIIISAIVTLLVNILIELCIQDL